MNAASPNVTILTLRCRLIPDFNLSTAVVAGIAMMFAVMAILHPPKPSEIGSSALAIGSLFALPLYWLIARLRGAIVLDENGVRWRTAFLNWKSARWDEIQSCDGRVTSSTTQWKFVVSTRRGRFSWTKAFRNAEQFAPFASRFCGQIPAEVEDWPRVFGYRSAENWMFPLAFPLFGAWLIAPLWMLSSSPREWMAQIADSARLIGWPLTLLEIAVIPSATTLMPAGFLMGCYLMWRQQFSHRDQLLVADSSGLTWHRKGREPLFAAWPELQILHVEAKGKGLGLPQFRLETARGEFSWNSGLSGRAQFRRLIRERAPQLREISAENLKSSLSPAPRKVADALIFDFKTRGLRAFSWFSAIFSLSCLGVALLGPLSTSSDQDPMPPWFFVLSFVSIGAATLYCQVLFWRGKIVMDSRGIEWKLPLKNHFAAWESIEAIRVGRESWLRVEGKKVAIYPVALPPAHFEVFVEEIERRLGERVRN